MANVNAIGALKQAIPNGVFTERGEELYETLNGSYLSGFQSDLKPSCIVQPRTKEDVAVFLKTASSYSDSVTFAVRGGGQQPAPGSANIQDGITLDLRLLTGIDVSDGIVKIGAGERWGSVYERLGAEGLAVAGGRSMTNGIGGLALEGGLSFFSSAEGFICDNVINYEVVLASGEIVNANADDNVDLWTALKGAGNNLGIVTRYDLRTFKQGKIWGGFLFYFAPSFPSQLEALVQVLHDPVESKKTHLMVSIGYSSMFGSDVMCLNQPYYLDAVENPPVLDAFSKMQPQIDALNTMRLQTATEAAVEQSGGIQSQVRCAYMNITVKADVATLQAATDIYTGGLDPVKSVEGLTASFTLQPYPVSLIEQSEAAGGNSLGLKSSDGPLVSLLLLSYWKNKSDDDAVVSFMKDSVEKMERDAASRGQLVPFVYMNYAWTHQDPISSYGAENKKKLQQASKKYDPEGLFQKACPGGFKLFP
ncbi:hypothetical protein VMCG_08650 [Cytospora schulzeri]|uniref:FAD-binding PCMH-type domain-containing protein n=1 Tax=Cytospora schulzeri TaxID=448051 RepID=A0A423VTE5_9PEZI|nr:hypothetical protein VMCG_08650 [Valsa malicola]